MVPPRCSATRDQTPRETEGLNGRRWHNAGVVLLERDDQVTALLGPSPTPVRVVVRAKTRRSSELRTCVKDRHENSDSIFDPWMIEPRTTGRRRRPFAHGCSTRRSFSAVPEQLRPR